MPSLYSRAALVRELDEELGIDCEVGTPVEITFHAYPADRATSGRAESVLRFLLGAMDGHFCRTAALAVSGRELGRPQRARPALVLPAEVAVLARARAARHLTGRAQCQPAAAEVLEAYVIELSRSLKRRAKKSPRRVMVAQDLASVR